MVKLRRGQKVSDHYVVEEKTSCLNLCVKLITSRVPHLQEIEEFFEDLYSKRSGEGQTRLSLEEFAVAWDTKGTNKALAPAHSRQLVKRVN